MSVLVKGMKMPETCIQCPMQFGGWCYVSPPEIDERVAPTVDEAVEQGKPDWCPLVEVPTPHGRLIDRDAFEKDLALNVYDNKRKTMSYPTVVCNTILKTPTIIEAEE